MDFLRQAAADPQVLAIKQTLYRTGADSPIVDALVAAAQCGKDVTVVIELRARFDEEANIELANRLQEAGAHVMYGVVGYKTHAKMVLVVRREADGIRRYCHLGTGNYHPRTARAYTDYGLFTCDRDIGQDVHEIFLQLTSLTQTPRLRLPAAVAVHAARGDCSRRSIARPTHARGGPAGAHHRQDERAGRAADHRGAVPRLARRRADRPDRARHLRAAAGHARRVREHPRALDRRPLPRALARLLLRATAASRRSTAASADWMERNFFRRVEIAFPILRSGTARRASCATSRPTWRQHARPGLLARRRPATGALATGAASRGERAAGAARSATLLAATGRRRLGSRA